MISRDTGRSDFGGDLSRPGLEVLKHTMGLLQAGDFFRLTQRVWQRGRAGRGTANQGFNRRDRALKQESPSRRTSDGYRVQAAYSL